MWVEHWSKTHQRPFYACVETGEWDEARLLDAALRCARRRVVVKRMRSAAALASAAGLRAPDYAVSGSTNRFDVYNVQPA